MGRLGRERYWSWLPLPSHTATFSWLLPLAETTQTPEGKETWERCAIMHTRRGERRQIHLRVNRKLTHISTHKRSVIHSFYTYPTGPNPVMSPPPLRKGGCMPKKKRVIWKIVTMAVSTTGTYITNSTGGATVGNAEVNELSFQLVWATNIVMIQKDYKKSSNRGTVCGRNTCKRIHLIRVLNWKNFWRLQNLKGF